MKDTTPQAIHIKGMPNGHSGHFPSKKAAQEYLNMPHSTFNIRWKAGRHDYKSLTTNKTENEYQGIPLTTKQVRRLIHQAFTIPTQESTQC